MKISGLNWKALLASAAVLAAAGLIAPVFLGSGEAPSTLVEAEVEMVPEGGDWLAVGDAEAPSEWLATHLGGDLDPTRAAVLIDGLARVYEETPRMIANRAAQLADETAGDPAPETLLADLAWDARSTDSFGAVAQNYLVLRRGGETHAAAIAALRRALGVGGTGGDG